MMNPEESYGVYRIVSPSGSCYIGMTTTSFKQRWSQHQKDFRSGKTRCSGLKNAFLKYGVEKMRFEILEDMEGYGSDYVLYQERIWWRRHKAWQVNLYNGEPSGTGSVIHTEETKKKISESMNLRYHGITHKPETICQNCGRKFTLKRLHRNKYCSYACTGKAVTKQDYSISELKHLYLVEMLSIEKIKNLTSISKPRLLKIFKEASIPMRSQHKQKTFVTVECAFSSCSNLFTKSTSEKKVFCSKSCGAQNRHSG